MFGQQICFIISFYITDYLTKPSPKIIDNAANLAREHSRSWESVAGEGIIDVNCDTRVSRSDVSWNREVARARASASSNLNLGTGDVKLRSAAGVVERNLLNTEEVVSTRDGRGNRGRVCLCITHISI